MESINLDHFALAKEQQTDEILSALQKYLMQCEISPDVRIQKVVNNLADRSFVENDVLWLRVKNEAGPKVVILVPGTLVPLILQEAHGHLLTGHDGLCKKPRLEYPKITSGPEWARTSVTTSGVVTGVKYVVLTIDLLPSYWLLCPSVQSQTNGYMRICSDLSKQRIPPRSIS